MTIPLHIVRLVLDRHELARLARRHHLRRSVDDGYLLHAGLAQLFATSTERAIVPLHTFAIDDTLPQARRRPDCTYLLAYSDSDEATLWNQMGQTGRTLVHVCKTKPVPEVAEGTRVMFRVRACPIVRTRRPVAAGTQTDGGRRGKSREVDAWLASAKFEEIRNAWKVDEALPFDHSASVWSGRETVYRQWLEREVSRNGTAVLDGPARLTAFKRDRLYRRDGSSGHVIERPDAVIEGILRIQDQDGFHALLRRGIGRHRAFGFGMLLLRPVRD